MPASTVGAEVAAVGDGSPLCWGAGALHAACELVLKGHLGGHTLRKGAHFSKDNISAESLDFLSVKITKRIKVSDNL